jgi:DNA-binding transcriptional LysR family regulator
MIDPLTLDHMRVLSAVAETGSFSAAARKLGRVQSAVSQAVQTMEATLGLALFDRSRKTPTLTDAGAAMLEDARATLLRAHPPACKPARARSATIWSRN